jgi:threonine/homoserine/homoserine lactone efflux protein
MELPVDPARYAAFLAIMAVMAITPGPANIFAIATGMQRGKRQALIGVAGMNLASLVWFVGAALGLGALVAAFPKAFHLLAVAGAIYVAWLGLKSIWSGIKGGGGPIDAPKVHGERSALIDGFSVQIANPKALLFFTAVLPPFVDVSRPILPQLVLFAVAMLSFDILSMSAYGLGGAALSNVMTRPAFRRGFAFLVGGLLIAAAILIFLRG